MKHWMGIVLAAGLCFCTACGSGGESSQTSQAEVQTEQATATVPAPEYIRLLSSLMLSETGQNVLQSVTNALKSAILSLNVKDLWKSFTNCISYESGTGS